MYAIILAGGGGTRLWPLSDPSHPKPFLPLFDDGSLLQKTVHRLTAGGELALSSTDLTVVTDQRYDGLVREQLPAVAVLSEPMGRNTAAAIAYAVLAVDRDPDEVMVVLPADHLVHEEAVFRGVLADAEQELARGAFGVESPIVTLGAQPTGPSIHFGYLVPDLAREQQRNLRSYALREFAEKPDADRAADLLRMGGVAWNAGIFMARRRAFRAALMAHAPELMAVLGGAVSGAADLAAAYERVTPISIDYAVMEPSAAAGQVVMAAMDVGWSDVGTWRALLDALVAPDGGYDGAAVVVQAGEVASLASDDVAVIRTTDNELVLERGPGEISSAQPIGVLPDARRYSAALQQLLTRVNSGAAQRAEARA
ncbi:MAG: sugar phosphate nucleotidyltransferase [Chloroflexota bacterium]